MILKINTISEIPIYIQLKNQIILGIANGSFKQGDKMPSIRQLAEDIGINMMTVKKAYSLLKDEGYIEIDRRHGAKISVKKEPEEILNKVGNELDILISQLLLKGLSKEQILDYVNKFISESNS